MTPERSPRLAKKKVDYAEYTETGSASAAQSVTSGSTSVYHPSSSSDDDASQNLPPKHSKQVKKKNDNPTNAPWASVPDNVIL